MRRIVAVLGMAFLLAGCASGFDRPVHEMKAVTGADRVQRIQVTTHSFWFEPNRLVVTRGVPVELTIRNGAFLVPHDLSCDAKDAGIDIDQHVGMFHGSKTVRFTPTRAGEYHFHCDVDHHAKKGMMGMLVVIEP